MDEDEEEVDVSMLSNGNSQDKESHAREALSIRLSKRREKERLVEELFTECQNANTWMKEELVKDPVRMNLEKINFQIDPNSPFELETIEQDCVVRWMQMFDQFPMTVQGRIMAENAVVKDMNKWVGLLCLSNQTVEVVLRVPDKNSYYFQKKSVPGFQMMLQHAVVTTYNKYDFNRVLHLDLSHKSDITRVSSVVARNEDGSIKVMPRVRPEIKSLATIWLEHDLRAIYSQIKFNPRPENFKKSLMSNELNMWAGHRIKRDHILKFTNWCLLTLFMNHLRFTWCNNDLEFCYLLCHFAKVIQHPWIKQHMCLGVNGEQKSGKTLVFLILGSILGDKHFVHLHSMEVILIYSV